MAQAEAAAKEQCRAAQEEAEGHLAVLEARQQQDDVLKGEIERLSSELKEAEFERLSTGDKDREIEALQAQLQEAGMQPVVSVRLSSGMCPAVSVMCGGCRIRQTSCDPRVSATLLTLSM